MQSVSVVRTTLAAVTLAVTTQVGAAPISYGTYYEDLFINGASCINGFCRVNFSQLPSNNLFMLSKINCNAESVSPLTEAYVSISQASNGPTIGRIVWFNAGPGTFVGSAYNYSFEADVRMLMGQGRFPYVVLFAGGGGSITARCGIVGDLVPPTP
ncbi:hypothetical protein [Bradyrhizobium manausense]|uniref:hypothetical protein n=1 Tax=Bradyrhizobium manausense TaxID=989370 RepID=UPI001BA77D25|nr:hypothetical protein [Bradyrhizobium manausense]MBR0725465.1 hypothetical protein [Bradyrhizobium manausense]